MERRYVQKSAIDLSMTKYNPVISARSEEYDTISDNPESTPFIRSEEDYPAKVWDYRSINLTRF